MKIDPAITFKEQSSGCLKTLKNLTCSRRPVVLGLILVVVIWFLVNLHQSHRIRIFHVNLEVDENKKPERPHAVRFEEMHDRWIVITTISKPTKDVKKLAEIKGWKVVVVGDRKTPSNWTFPGCVFLDLARQASLGYSLTGQLPTNSYTRKNIGYLYAIQHGARYIYDTDDDNHPTSGRLNFEDGPGPMTGLLYEAPNTTLVMNPYAHFGQGTIWPRGYPLDDIEVPNSNAYRLASFKVPVVQQGVVNGDPDVDAIFRLTRKKGFARPINVTFDAKAPPVLLPEGIFAPFNSQNTFFRYEALWALYLPSSVAFRVTDIWRGYWVQRLLWLLGHKMAFFPPNAVQLRNAHDYLDDFRDENQFYLQTGSLVSFLANWTCPVAPTVSFFGCVSALSSAMADAEFWDRRDAEMVDAWLMDLKSIGYQEPEMMAVESTTTTTTREDPESRRVFFSANIMPDPDSSSAEDPLGPSFELNLFCRNIIDLSSVNETRALLGTRPRHVFDDLLLVVVFNFPYYANMRTLDALYYNHFPNIVYCGQTQSYEKLEADIGHGPEVRGRRRLLSFINITSSGGYFGYECAVLAMKMHYDVRGYVVVGDDVMFNFWNFHQLVPDMARLMISSYRPMDRHQDPKKQGWMWWGSEWGQVPLEKVLKEMESIAAKEPSDERQKLVKQYVENRFANGLNMSAVSICLGDMYYIPSQVAAMFVEVMSIFLKQKVFLEIAIPTTVAGLHPTQSHLQGRLWGPSLWGGDRSKPFDFFNSSADFLHPLKLSGVFKNDKARQDYCHNYIHHLLHNW